MGIISTSSISSQQTPSINIQDSILCYLPKTFKDQIRTILTSSDQINSVEMICDFTASWIQILDDETQEKIYTCFSNICRASQPGDANWGKDHIQDPDKIKGLYKTLRSVFPEKSNILINNRLISFVKSEAGIHLIKYLDRENLAKLSTCCSELFRAVPDMYFRGGICMLERYVPKDKSLPAPYGLTFPKTINAIIDIADGIFYCNDRLIAYHYLCDFISSHGTNILNQFVECDVFDESKNQRNLDLLSKLIPNFRKSGLDQCFIRSLNSSDLDASIVIYDAIRKFDVYKKADLIGLAKNLGRLSDVRNYFTEIQGLIPEEAEDAECYLRHMVDRSEHLVGLMLNENFDEVIAKINEGEIVLDMHLSLFIHLAVRLNDPAFLEKVISYSDKQSYFRGEAVISFIQNENFDAAFSLLGNFNTISEDHRGSAVIYAAKHNNFRFVEFLLADNNRIDGRSAGYALSFFAEQSRIDLIERFINEYPGISGDDRANAALSAVKNNSLELAELLLSSPHPISDHIVETITLDVSMNLAHNLRMEDFSKVTCGISILKKIIVKNRRFKQMIKSRLNYQFSDQVRLSNIDMVKLLLSLDVEIPESVLRLLNEGPSVRLSQEMYDFLTSVINAEK
ncbi:MAG: hypothetical protein FJZ57_04680 [Chlamydiae bacterium]|nr:hypothetical protein [Chlamydiota bacterium]